VTNAPVAIGGSAPHQLAAAPGTPTAVTNVQPTQPSMGEDTMLTPILSAVLGAALSVAPASTTSLPPSSTTPHILGACQTGYVLESGENYGDDVSPMPDAELYFYHYTSEAFRKTHDVDSSLNNPMQAQVEVLVPPKYGELLDEGNPASGEWYRQGFEGKHLYRYVPDKGHETDSDRFTIRVTLKSVQVDIQYHMEAVPFGYRPDESCPREIWKISQIDVKDLDGTDLASTGFTPDAPTERGQVHFPSDK
jgi:hypothetical protein